MAGRNPKVCFACLGNADTTQHKCNGKFGDASCNDWLWGWFVVDDTVERASKKFRVANDSASHNISSPNLPDIREVCGALNVKYSSVRPDPSARLVEDVLDFVACAGKIKNKKKELLSHH